MKLRLPHRLQTAILTAFASVTFFTVGTASLGAARGEEAPEFASFTDTGVEVSEEELKVNLGEEEEEETKEPDSAPTNHAGFNGIRESSDDADRQLANGDISESTFDTENVGTADQANYTGTSADLPSNDLGFTSNPYASDSSSGSGVDSPVTSFTQAPQIAPTGGDSAAGIGSGSSTSNETSTSPGVSIGSGLGAFGGGYYPAFAAAPSLTSVPAAAGPGAAASTNLGKFLFMGDSITHGVVDQTYRWQMFKGFVDNGISFDLNGPRSGYSSNPTNMNDAGSAYGGVAFENVHYAESSGRAYQMISGQNHYVGWPVSKVGQTDYDTYTLMIGTNDILSDTADPVSYATYADKFDNLLGGTVSYTGADKSLDAQWTWTKGSEMSGNLNTILNSLSLDEDDNFYVLSIPVWAQGHGNHNNASDHAAVAGYNTMLQQWVAEYNKTSPANVQYVDVNKGITDVTVPDRGGVGPYDFFSNNDRLHPSQQGSIIIGGNLSRGMGLAGRTAGLHRADTTGWKAATTPITLASGASQEIVRDAFIEDQGYTIDFHATFGDGATGGWLDAGIHTGNMNAAAQNVLAITIGDGINSGTLNLAEGYIMWGSNILYCQDNSQSSNDAIRIAYHNGSTADNVAEGYYVWLGDMLIGQGLNSTPGQGWNGIKVSSTGGSATLTGLMYTNTAYAPETDFAVGSNPYYVTQDRGQTVLVPTREAASDHHADPISSGVDWTTATPVSYTGSGTARYAQNGAGSSGELKAVAMNLTSSGQSSWIAAKGGNADYTGDIALQLVEGSYGCATVFGVVNGATLDGNATVELNSSNATISSFTTTGAASVIGGYKGNITGTFKAVINAGTLSNAIVGGYHTADAGNHIGAVELVVNGGTVNGNVYGGSINNAANGKIDGNISIAVTDGTINGSIIGTGTAGTIGGSQINIVLSGGVITGDVMGRNSGFNYAGTTNVTVDGYKPLIKGNITADNVTLRGVTDTEYAGYMDTYRGTVTANSSIILDNYTAKDVMAKLVTQDLTVSGTTNTTIHDLTLTSCSITAGEGTDLTLADSLTLGNAASFSGNITLADGLVIDMTAAGEHQGYSDGDNGYLNNVVVFKQADNAAAGSSIEADWSTIQGAGALQGATFSQDASGNVTAGGITTGSYHITTGTVYYGGPNAPEDIKTAHDLILEPTSSATLVMAANFEPDCVGGITVAENAVGARLRINAFQEDGTTPIVILASNVHADAGLVLEGDGTYSINSASLGTNVSLDANAWSGTVRLAGFATNGENLATSFTKNGSWVEMYGITNGFLSGWNNGQETANIILTNPDADTVAWKWDNGSSSGETTITFTGKWKGDGTFLKETNNKQQGFTFTGDISEWTGDFRANSGAVTKLEFAGSASDVNIGKISNEGSAALNIVVSNNATIASDISKEGSGAVNLTVAAGKHATFEGTTGFDAATIGGTVYNTGDMTLGGTVTVNAANISAFEVYDSGSSGSIYSGKGEYAGSGFLVNDTAQYYIVKSTDGGTLTDNSTIAGSGYTKVSGVENALVVSGDADKTIYYVNGNLTYADSEMGPATGITIAKEATLTSAGMGGSASAKVLHGDGTYVITDGNNNFTSANGYGLGKSFSLGTDWAGTVVVSGTSTSNLVDFARLANGKLSTVEVKGLNGWTYDWNGAIEENIKLTDVNGTSAWKNSASTTTSSNLATFSGIWSGQGTFERTGSNTMHYKYTGDISAWEGKFLLSGNATTNVIFAGNAREVNAVIDRTNGNLTVVAETDVTFNKNITATGFTNAANTVTLGDGVKVRIFGASAGHTSNFGKVNVAGSATIENYNYHGSYSISSITGAKGTNLTLWSNHSALPASWNIGNASAPQDAPFEGTLTLKVSTDQTSAGNREVTYNLNDGGMLDGATLQLQNGTTGGTLTNNIRLGARTVKVGGVTDAATGTVTGTRKWNIGSASGTNTLQITGDGEYTSEVVINSGVNLAMSGEGSQTFNGDLSAMAGTVKVSNGTLTLNNSSANKGILASVTVTGGTLNLDNMNVTGATEVTGGMLNLTSSVQTSGLTVADGTTLKLAGENKLTVNGLLTLEAGATLDLANIFASPVQQPVMQAAPKSGGLLGAVEPAAGAMYVLATANEIDLASSGINLQNLADGYRGTLSTQDATGGSGKELILTLAELSKNLVWDNAQNNNRWDVATTQNWHKDGEQAGSSTFAEGDNVTFQSGAGTAQLQDNITAGTMTLQSGANLTVDTNNYNLTVANLVSANGSNLTKTGAGTATFGGDANTPVSLGTLTVSGGTANFEGGPVTANKFTTSGADTAVTFDEKVTLTGSRVEINYNWNATSNSITFAKGLDFTGAGTNNYAMAIGNGDTVSLGGVSDFHDKALGIASRGGAFGKLVLLEDATLSLGRVYNTTNAAENGAVELREGSVLNISGNGGGSTISKLSGAGDINVNAQTLLVNGHENFTGDIALANTGALDINATNFGGKIANTGTGTVTMYGTAGQVANENARIAVTKKTDQQLILAAGSETAISKVTVASGNTTWLLVGATAQNDADLYTDIDFKATGTTQNALILNTANTTSHIGSLSSDTANTQVRGDWDSQTGGRVLAVHQDDDTTFAGYFMDNKVRSVGLDKYGEGTLTLTGQNVSTSAMNIYEGTIKLDGSGKWTGATTVHDDGTLALTSSVTNLANTVSVNDGGTLTLGSYKDSAVTAANLTLASGSILDLSNLSFTGDEKGEITLINGGAITVDNLSAVTLNFSDSTLQERATLSKSGNNLVLTFTPLAQDLIWDNNAANNAWSGNNWHTATSPQSHIAFEEGDNVQFTVDTPNAAPELTENVKAGTMTIDSGASVNVNTNGNTLTVADLDSAGGILAKSGAGEAAFGGADVQGVELAGLTVSGGTASFDEKVKVSGNISMTGDSAEGPTLNLNGGAVVNGTVAAQCGTINVAGESSFNVLDMGSSSTAEVVVKDKGILTLHQLSLSDGSKLTLEKGGRADLLGKVWVEGLEGNGEVLGTGTCSIDSADVTLKNVAVSAQGRVDIGNKLEGSTITIDTSYVSLTNAANTLTTTTVNGAWLDVQAGMQLGDVAVNGGELRLTSSSPVTINSGSIGSAGKLTLSEAEQFTVSGGEFSFASGSTLDLSALSIDGSTPITLGTASGTGSISSHNLGNVILYFGPESTYDNAFLEVDANHNLVLNFVVAKDVLYWKGGPGTWDTDPENKSWYPSGDITQKVAFEGGENIVFSVQGESVVTVTEQTLTTGDVVVEQGVNLSLSSANGTALTAGKVDVKGNLTVSNVAVTATSLNIERGSRVTADVEGTRAGALATNVSGAGDVVKKGAGSLTLTGDNAEFSGTVTIEEGTLIAGGDAGTALGDSPNVVLNGGELKGAITPGDDINITAAKDGATVSADIQVAGDKALTFNTNGGVTLTTSGNISGAGDVYKSGTGTLVLDAANSFTGNLDINAGTVLVSNVGAVSGSSNVTVGTGSNLVFEKDPSAYDVNQITLDRGSTLTFSEAVGLGETPLLHIGTLDLTSAAAMDFSNIPLDKTGSYVLASVDNIVASEPGIWRPGQELLQFITMQGINGAARTPDTLTSLYYRNGKLILDLKDPNSGFYWKPSDDDEVQSWNETDPRWSSKSDLTGDPVNFTNNDPRTGATPKSVYFLDAGTDGKEKVQLDIEGYTTYINDLVIANGEYWFIAPEGEIKDIHMQTEVLSNFVVREGAKAHFEGVSVSDGNFNVIHVCAGAEASVEGMPTWGVYSMNNEGKFSVVSDLMGIENLLAHVDNSGVMSILYHDSAEGMAMVGELSNRAGAEMTIAAPFLMSDFMGSYGDGVLHNMGELTYDVTGYNQTGRMETYLPIDGTGSFKTIGAEATVALGETVVQTSMELGAGRTEFIGLVTISDSTTVKDGAEAVLSAGGTLGEVTLESNATLQLEGDGTTPKIYRGGTLVAGEGSVLKVDEDASLTIDSYNAGDSDPVGAIEVGGGSGNPALLTVEGKTNAASLTVYDGEAHLHGGGSVTSLTQSGGTARFCSDAYLGGGSVTGGTLLVEDGQELTVGSAINVTSGNYTVAATTGTINADKLELKKDTTNTVYVEVKGSDEGTKTQSGFLKGGEQYVQLFNLAEEATLASNGVTVTHKEAAGPMTLIGTGDTKHPDKAGYGYLDTSVTVYASYYVRDNYVSGQHGTRAGSDRSPDSVKLSDVMETSKNGGTTPQLETVVFDKTDYNKDEAVSGSLTVDVQGQHADLFDVKEGAVGIVNIGTDAKDARVMLCCCEDFDKVDGTMLIAGTGIYQLENRGDLGGGVSLLSTKTEGIEAWTGTVRITGSGEQLVMAPLAVGSGANASEIEFSHWTGSFENKEETVVSDARILLTGTGMDAAPAITLTPGDADMKWTNTVTGNNARIVNHEGGNFSLTMTGDTSGWNGTLDQGSANTTMNVSFLLDTTTASGQGENATVQNAGLLTHDGTMNATYGGGLKTVNGDVQVYENGTINLHYTGTGMQVNSNIEKFLKQGDLSITVGDGTNDASATFSGKFTNTETTTMTVEKDSSATIDTNAALLRVVGGQGSSVAVNSGKTLSLASTDPVNDYSQFYNVDNQGTISMMASGGDIKLVDTTGHTDAFNLGNLVLADTPGTAAIETSGVNGKTTDVNITALSGTTNVLKLTNDNATGTVNYNLGGAGSSAAFSGKIAYGVNGGNGAAADLVIKGDDVAANAVLETAFAASGDTAAANIVVDTAHAKVLGLSSDANSATNKTMVVSGTEGSANKVIEITGNDEYTYAGKLGGNLDVTYSGTGTQTIQGGVDGFRGAVKVESAAEGSGTLAIQNLMNGASVNITDLTIGASDTLDLNDGSNVGTAEVSGTMKARGTAGNYSKLDGNLTMGSGSTYDVSAAGGTGGLDLGGELTISKGATLSAGDIAKIYDMEIGKMYDLAFDVTTFNGVAAASGFKDKVPFGDPIDASELFAEGQFWKGEYYVCFSGAGTNGGKGGNVGTVYLYKATPEPTTGTLSLLALAALAARRRRK